jgi:nucleotide-binding universal stress UspA family protein
MSQAPAYSRYSEGVFVRSILCTTDFSPESINAFAHALMMAMSLRCQFTLLHASGSAQHQTEWSRLPGVRDLLERWGYLEKGSPRSAVFEKLAVDVTKVHVVTPNALGALLDYLQVHPADLVVAGLDGPVGAASWREVFPPVNVVRSAHTMTLIIPAGGKAFVSPATGDFALKSVLVPVATRPDPHPALIYAFRTAVFSSEELIRISLLHVGDDSSVPMLNIPERPYLKWELLIRPGEVAEEILRAAEELDCELIVMTIDGDGGFSEALQGSVTQEVVRCAKRPVLVVPVGS